MGKLAVSAMCPSIMKITNPETKLVMQLMELVIKASLQQDVY